MVALESDAVCRRATYAYVIPFESINKKVPIKTLMKHLEDIVRSRSNSSLTSVFSSHFELSISDDTTIGKLTGCNTYLSDFPQ